MWVLSTSHWQGHFLWLVSEDLELLKRRAEEMVHPRSEKLRAKLAARWHWDEVVPGWVLPGPPVGSCRIRTYYWIEQIERVG